MKKAKIKLQTEETLQSVQAKLIGNRVRPELIGKVECLNCGKPVSETCCDWPVPAFTPEEVKIVAQDFALMQQRIQRKTGKTPYRVSRQEYCPSCGLNVTTIMTAVCVGCGNNFTTHPPITESEVQIDNIEIVETDGKEL
jgi:protein-arginine kinase activator protein McsA